jgi:hypothetical protein
MGKKDGTQCSAASVFPVQSRFRKRLIDGNLSSNGKSEKRLAFANFQIAKCVVLKQRTIHSAAPSKKSSVCCLHPCQVGPLDGDIVLDLLPGGLEARFAPQRFELRMLADDPPLRLVPVRNM